MYWPSSVPFLQAYRFTVAFAHRLSDIVERNQNWVDTAHVIMAFERELSTALRDGTSDELDHISEWLRFPYTTDRFTTSQLSGGGSLGGMVVPALIYLAINGTHPDTRDGWAIPSATYIAFALGVAALLGSRVPASLKAFLAALAIIDDLGAVVIIAVFYTPNLSLAYLLASFAVIAAMVVLNRTGVRALAAYLVLGAVLWVFVHASGVHATLAGVATALCIPLRDREGRLPSDGDCSHSPLLQLEHALHRLVPVTVLPLFGFANAGISFSGIGLAQWLAPCSRSLGTSNFKTRSSWESWPGRFSPVWPGRCVYWCAARKRWTRPKSQSSWARMRHRILAESLRSEPFYGRRFYGPRSNFVSSCSCDQGESSWAPHWNYRDEDFPDSRPRGRNVRVIGPPRSDGAVWSRVHGSANESERHVHRAFGRVAGGDRRGQHVA
jgi:hypothetical protein